MASSDKIPVNYLVFDDQNEEADQNKIEVSIKGMKCNLIFLNPLEFLDPDTNIYDIESLTQRIKELVLGKEISLIASDWNMVPQSENYGEINALEIIKILVGIHEKFKKTQYLIYSGKPKDVSSVIFKTLKKEMEKGDEPIQSKELLSLLLALKIKFSNRNQRFEEINTLIKSGKTISLIVLNALSKFESHMVVETGNEHFDGRSIEELLDLISQGDDKGLKFISEFIDLSIANYTELNG